MKLAEALLLRSDYRAKLNQLEMRILNNAKVQEDMVPEEDPNLLVKELLDLNDSLAEMIRRINLTNQYTQLNEDMTLTDAIVLRESARNKFNTLTNISSIVSERDYRLTRSEIKMNLVLSTSELQKTLDTLAKEVRMLDSLIQEKNWLTELL